MSQHGRYYAEQWNVESTTGRVDKHGDPVHYTVSLKEDGGWECSCPAWIFQRKRRGDCKHILAIQVEMERQGGRESVSRLAREERKPMVVVTDEFRAELVLEGRLKGLLNNL